MNTLQRHCTNLVVGEISKFPNSLFFIPGAFHVVSVRHIRWDGGIGDENVLIAGVSCKDLEVPVRKPLLEVWMVVDHPVHPDHPVVVQPVCVHSGVNLEPAAGLEDEELGFPLQRRRLPVVELAEYVFDGHLDQL